MRQIVLDTSAVSGFFAGRHEVLDELGRADLSHVSVIVLGELLAGFRGGTRLQENRDLLTAFLSRPTVDVLNVTTETSEVFGQVKDTLKRAGTPIPINDLWIAAHGLETGSVLVTYDSHFKLVPGLRIWDHLS